MLEDGQSLRRATTIFVAVVLGCLVLSSCSPSGSTVTADSSTVPLVTVDNIAALKALDISGIESGTLADVLGFYAPGDGGGGSFVWNPTDTSPESSGLTVAPSSAPSGCGRWNRIYDPSMELTVLAVGAVPDGVTDNSSILSFAACKSGIKFRFPSGSYVLSTIIKNTLEYYRPSATDGSPKLTPDPYSRMLLCQGASNFTWDFESDAFLVVDPASGHCRSTGVGFDRDHNFQLLNGPNIKGCRTGLGQVENVAMTLSSDTDFLMDGIKCVEGFNGGACVAADWIANGTIDHLYAPNISKAFDVAFMWNITVENSSATGLNADGVSIGVDFWSLIFDYPNQYNNFSGLAGTWPASGTSDVRLTNNTASNFITALNFLTGKNITVTNNTLCNNPGRPTIPAQGIFPQLVAEAGYGVTITYQNGGTSYPSNGHAADMISFDGDTICQNGTVQKGGGILINGGTIPTDGSDPDMLGSFYLNSGTCTGNNSQCLVEAGLSKITAVTTGPDWISQ